MKKAPAKGAYKGTYAEAAIYLMGGTTDNFSFSITMY